MIGHAICAATLLVIAAPGLPVVRARDPDGTSANEPNSVETVDDAL
jgi:hypothetical protein